jgi:ribonuclease HIII
LARKNYEVGEPAEIAYGLQFYISGQAKGLFRVYANKKNQIKLDDSQIHGDLAPLREVLDSFSLTLNRSGQNTRATMSPVGKTVQFSNINLADLGYPIIGSDESGKGDYFGPLVSAAVYVDETSAQGLKELGVRDSKKLNDHQSLELAVLIRGLCAGRYAVVEIAPIRYNDLYTQLKKEGKNLNHLLAWGHAKALEKVLQNIPCDLAVADKFADEKYIISKLQERGKRIRLIQQPRAEENIAVAAASILARERFLLKLKSLSAEFSVTLPKGANQGVSEAAERLMQQFGFAVLSQVAKVHFKTTEQLRRPDI